MKIEERVCTRGQMKFLGELGFDTTKASMIWTDWDIEAEGNAWCVRARDNIVEALEINCIPTFSIGEMLEMLPESIKKYDADWEETYEYFLSISKEDGKWQIVYKFYSYILERDEMVYSSTADSLRDALFAELKTLKENKEI